MEKKRNLLDRIKRFFSSDLKSKEQKREKRKLFLFKRLRSKKSLPTITAATHVTDQTLSEVQASQSKHALAVAVATAAAAEAAVAAAQAAAQVVRLTSPIQPYHRDKNLLHDKSAVKIQTAFRGYLARKALKALKGLVKLQAMVRGQAVRRQTQSALKSLQVIVNIQSQAQASKSKIRQTKQVVGRLWNSPRQGKSGSNIKLMIDWDGRRWDGSLLTKEETDARYANRRDAVNRRERTMQYEYSHQKSKTKTKTDDLVREAALVPEAECERLPSRNSWLDRWVDSETWRREPEIEHLASTHQNVIDKQFYNSNVQNQSESPCCDHIEETQFRRRCSSPLGQRRTSFHHIPKKNTSIRDDDASFTSSPACPSYMASTVSANGRARSTSTPKERTKICEFNLHGKSPSYYREAFHSINSDAGNPRRLFRPSSSHQRSPRVKGLTVPVKSDRCWKDYSLDSESTQLNVNKNARIEEINVVTSGT